MRRQGRVTKAQQRALDTLRQQFVLDNYLPLDAAAVFGNDKPLWLDIGFGMGESTLYYALANPDINLIAVDIYRAGIGALLMKLAAHNLANVRVYDNDVVNLIAQRLFTETTFAQILVLHPDPWPKNKHHKRRLLQTTFLQQLARLLSASGKIDLRTDDCSYAAHIDKVIEQLAATLRMQSVNLVRPSTSFFKKSQHRQHAIFDYCLCQTT